MKKFLLGFAALVLAATTSEVRAQGATCEEATPFPMYIDGSTIPNGAWYSITVTEGSMFPSSAPVGLADGNIVVYEGCNGREAVKLSTNTYYLEPGIDYKVFIKLRSSDFFFPNSLSLQNAPAGMYCVKPIVLEGLGQTQEIKGARTVWYQIDVAYNAPLQVKSSDIGMPLASNVTKVVTKHLECRGGTNESNELLPQQTYVKAGTNLVQVTTNAAGNINFTLDAMNATGCGNRPQYAPALELNAETMIPNAYYTVSRKFTIPETGRYAFTLNAAEGTEFSLASLVDKACDFDTKPLSATVGSDNKAVIVAEYNKDDVVVLHADMPGAMNGTPSMKVEKSNDPTGIFASTTSTREVLLSENPTDGIFTLTSALLNNGAEIGIYDMSAKRVWGTTVKGGAESYTVDAANLPAGTYLIVVYGVDRSATAKLVVK